VPLPVTLTVWLVAVATNLNHTSLAVPEKPQEVFVCEAKAELPAVVEVQVVLPAALAVSKTAPQGSSLAGGVITQISNVLDAGGLA
jgi:hypothetical protein